MGGIPKKNMKKFSLFRVFVASSLLCFFVGFFLITFVARYDFFRAEADDLNVQLLSAHQYQNLKTAVTYPDPWTSSLAYQWRVNNTPYMALTMPFNSGTQADISAWGNNGDVTGATLQTTGCVVGSCLSFNGISNYVEIDDASSLSLNSSITISAWINHTTSNSEKSIVTKDRFGSGADRTFGLEANGGNVAGRVRFFLSPNAAGSGLVILDSTITYPSNTWSHVVGSWDGSIMRIYVNGVQNPGTASFTGPLHDSAQPVRLGAISSSGTNTLFFDGQMDEVQIYPRALTAQQISVLYQDGLNNVAGPSLIHPSEHNLGEEWGLEVFEVDSGGNIAFALSGGTQVIHNTIDANNPANLCSGGAGQLADLRLDASELDFDGLHVEIEGCTFTIDGPHSFASLTIGDGVGTLDSILNHSATTTSNIYKSNLTISGATTIHTDGSINVNGRGFRENRTSDGVGGQTTTGAASAGLHSAGSHGGWGGIGFNGTSALPYGDIREPFDPGAGPGLSGAGGGAIKIITNDFIHHGVITANGSYVTSSGGAGGGIWISTTGVISGTGVISANGGYGGGSGTSSAGGGGGRIALYYDGSVFGSDISGLDIQAYGGTAISAARYGAAGTIYIEDSDQHLSGEGELIIGNNSITTSASVFTPLSSVEYFGAIHMKERALVQALELDVGDLIMESNSQLFHPATTVSQVYRLQVTANSIEIDSTSSINLNDRGFRENRTSDGVGGQTATGAATAGTHAAGSHGGWGGTGSAIAYDDFKSPLDPGSGPGLSGGGGGYLRIMTNDFIHNGVITANGSYVTSSGGGGGGIWISTTGVISGTGVISANGGYGGGSASSGGGGGGRIALYHDGSVLGSDISGLDIQAFGGTAITSTNYGAAGTIYIEDITNAVGDLFVANNSNSTSGSVYTPVFVTIPTGLPTLYTLQDLHVIDLARLLIDTPCSGTPALTVLGITDLSGGGTISNNQPGTCTFVQEVIGVVTTALPNGYVGVPYSQTIDSLGGYGPHTFECVDDGSPVACTSVLPTGLDMNSSGVISGTPTTLGVYPFTVRATEASPGSGFDEQSLSITVTDAPTVPDAITDLNATSGETQVTLTWTAPADNGSAITDYIVEYGVTSGFPGNAQVFSDGVSANTGATVTGLMNDTDYSFRVAAVNGVGTSPYSNVDTATPTAAPVLPNDTRVAQITVDINDFLSFSIENLAAGDEAAGDQPFGAGAQITDLTSTGNNDYAISGDFGSPVYTRLQTSTNSTDGYNVIAYAANLDGRTNTLLRSGGTPGSAADEISDSLNRLPASQAPNVTLVLASATGLAFRLMDANTDASLRGTDEDTQWGDGDAGTALWASFPLGSGAAQIIYDTLNFSETPTTAYLNWFVGISPQQRSGSYSGQVTFTASVN